MRRLKSFLEGHPNATGIALVASSSLALLVAAAVLGGQLMGPQSGEGTGSPSPSGRLTTPTPTSTPFAEPTSSGTASSAEPSPTPAVGSLAPGMLAAVVTTDLVVRSEPGTGDNSVIHDIRLAEPIVVFIVDGPVMADGYAWYLVDPVRDSALGDWPSPGWAAAAGQDEEPWLSPDPAACPQPGPTTLIGLPAQRGLACFGDSPQTVDGTLRGCNTREDYADLLSETACGIVRTGFDVTATPDPDCADCFEPGLRVAADSDLGLADLVPGASIRITGHYGDPSAQRCGGNDLMTGPPVLRVHACRLVFWATKVEFLNG